MTLVFASDSFKGCLSPQTIAGILTEEAQLAFPGWGVCAGLSAASVTLGLVVLFRPLLAGIALVRLIGAALLYIGLADLATLFLLWRLARHGRPADADPADPE